MNRGPGVFPMAEKGGLWLVIIAINYSGVVMQCRWSTTGALVACAPGSVSGVNNSGVERAPHTRYCEMSGARTRGPARTWRDAPGVVFVYYSLAVA